jgi:methyl-accepting chemotaxis protein
MSIATRLVLLLALALGAGAGVTALAAFGALRASERVEIVISESFAATVDADAAMAAFERIAARTDDLLDMRALPDMAAVHAAVTADVAGLDAAVAAMEAKAGRAGIGEELAALDAARARWLANVRIAIGMERAAAIPTRELLRREAAAVRESLSRISAKAMALAAAAPAASRAALEAELARNGAIGAGVLGLVGVVAVVAARRMGGTLHALSTFMRRLADGDLEGDAPGRGRRDEIGAIAEAAGVFAEALRARAALEADRRREEAARAGRAASRGRLFDRLSIVAGAAARGDFSGRIDHAGLDEETIRLANAVNELLEVVARGVSAAETMMRRMADADLTARMTGEFAGAFADLQHDAEAMGARLSGAMGAVQGRSAQISDRAALLAESAATLAESAEDQAAALAETTANVSAIAETVQANARRADTAVDATARSEASAEAGRRIMDDTVSAMREIERSAAQMAEIVSVLDGIAFQTNLLALNASVEAARAGEAGKGFAVVAQEVRTLALRAAESARDIGRLIRESGERVRNGTELAGSAGEALEEIKSNVADLAAIVREIAAETGETAGAIDSVRNAVLGLDDITRRNAAAAEQSRETVEAFRALARELSETSSAFRIDAAAASRAA